MATADYITNADQLFHASDLGRCELLRGELVMMSPVGSEHGLIAASIAALLRDYVKPRRLGVVLGAETGFKIASDPDTVRAPDVAFIRADRIGDKLPKGYFPGAPDLAVEVLSPDDRAGEVFEKVQNWLDAGCAAVWVIDPKSRTVTAYDAARNALVQKEAETIEGGEYLPGFRSPVAEFFAF